MPSATDPNAGVSNQGRWRSLLLSWLGGAPPSLPRVTQHRGDFGAMGHSAHLLAAKPLGTYSMLREPSRDSA